MKGMYGITQDTSHHERSFSPDPEGSPLFKAIFWSLIVSVTAGWIFGWLV